MEEGKSALKGFVKQFWIRGDDSIFPQEFLLKARGLLTKLLKENPQTKVKCILNCKMSRMVGDEEVTDEPFFHSRQKTNLGDMTIINEMEKEMIENLENFTRGGSNWVFEKVIRLEIHFVRWKPLGRSAWIPLPPALENKKALVNMINQDEKCFQWCIARAKNMVEIHPERITPELRKQAEEFNWKGCKFPMDVDKIKFFEAKNPGISINVYGWEGVVRPLKVVQEEKEFHVDLVLIVENFKSHFCLVKNFSRLVSSQLGFQNKRQRFFCKRCLNSFISDESLKTHKKICGEFKEAEIRTPGGVCSFSNFQKMMHVPVVGYADFESILKPTGKKDKTHERLPCGFAIHLVSPFLQMEPVLKRGENESENLGKDFILELISAVKKAHLNLPKKEMIPLTNFEWKKFREANVCWLCRKEFGEKNAIKVRDHCHYTGKFRGAAHQKCNLKFQRPKFTPYFFHNLQNYDAHLFVRALGLVDEVLEVKCIPSNEEKYISFSFKFELEEKRKHEIRFLDSFKFLKDSLSELVKALPKEDLKETFQFFGEKSELVSQKGFYPYEFMDGFEKFKKQLPKKTAFFSRFKQEGISEENYQHARKVWNEFSCRNMGDYHDLYLKSDVLLLADVMESFRKICEKNYELDPAHFFITPGLAWDAMLKMTDVELELLEDVDQVLMIENGIRGGNSNVFKRFASANNKFMSNFSPEETSRFLVYLDANNLYGWAMSQPLPVGEFEWMDEKDLENWRDLGESKGCILEVDLLYPEELHDLHNDFPLAPEILELGKVRKLTQNLMSKQRMVLHRRNLAFYLSLGMKLTKIWRGINFKESCFMKCYIDKNTKLRSQGKTKFEKDFFKLMNNSVFGKTIENLRKRVVIHLVKDAEKAAKPVNKSNFESVKIFDEFLIAVKMRKTKVFMTKPIYVGMTVLDLSKLLMYDFLYGYVRTKWEKCSLLYTDTDSLMLEIETDDFFADISGDVEKWFDTNNYSKELAAERGVPIFPENNKKIGLMKDECGGKILTEFVALRPKLYSFLTENWKKQQLRTSQRRLASQSGLVGEVGETGLVGEVGETGLVGEVGETGLVGEVGETGLVGKTGETGGTVKAKGVKTCMIRKSLRHENFLACLKNGNCQMRKQSLFRSRDHHLFTENMTKIALSAKDDKRIVLEDGINTLALGHWKLGKRKKVSAPEWRIFLKSGNFQD